MIFTNYHDGINWHAPEIGITWKIDGATVANGFYGKYGYTSSNWIDITGKDGDAYAYKTNPSQEVLSIGLYDVHIPAYLVITNFGIPTPEYFQNGEPGECNVNADCQLWTYQDDFPDFLKRTVCTNVSDTKRKCMPEHPYTSASGETLTYDQLVILVPKALANGKKLTAAKCQSVAYYKCSIWNGQLSLIDNGRGYYELISTPLGDKSEFSTLWEIDGMTVAHGTYGKYSYTKSDWIDKTGKDGDAYADPTNDNQKVLSIGLYDINIPAYLVITNFGNV
jgi:hypothetical protein